MKKNIKIFFIQLILLFLSLSLFAEENLLPRKANNYSDIFFYALTLYNEGAYEEAEVEFKRYLFMQNYAEGNYQSGAWSALAGLYEKKGNYSLAADCIQKALICMENDKESQSQIDALRLVHIQYLEKAAASTDQYLSDNLFIFSYMNLPDFSDRIKQEAYTAAIVNAVSKGRIEYADKTFKQALELFPHAWNEEDKNTIQTGFEKLMAFKPKNQRLAGYLSFFPGLGQLYARDYKDSLNAFLLNGSLIALSAWSICTLDFWTFSLLEFNPLLHFMQGNIYNAQKDAYYYNLNKQNQLSKPILDTIR